MCYRYIFILMLFASCGAKPTTVAPIAIVDTPRVIVADTINAVVADSTLPMKIVAFAKTLMGTRYSFGCMAPSTGFDCSGFIYYVFRHFDIEVPRSSVDFTHEGIQVALNDAEPGDLILFTGTNSKIRTVGHIGIIVANDGKDISFIHASSGEENKVIITLLNERYMQRFVKVIRYLP